MFHCINGPIAVIIDDIARFVRFDALSFNHSVESQFAVYRIFIGLERNVLDVDFAVVMQGSQIFLGTMLYLPNVIIIISLDGTDDRSEVGG
ncbi:hypothetical protein CJO09_06620 [Neopusillimonas maritima]|uniref:Uncharacterized protein n=1 Tax=Neopusillimonas maritima TaxID=2026239 RepID=A0ABX9MXK0_9BURK|nr:hypothetical protein CJO09_06620 [Neopusillimonas maritima]